MSETSNAVRIKVVPLPGENVDTDRIYPARFLLDNNTASYGKYLFHDERFDSTGAPKGHALDSPQFAGFDAALVGKNFGCGSSREHAAIAMKKAGVDRIIGESFGDIFLSNCGQSGIECFTAAGGEIERAMGEISSGISSFELRENECTLASGNFSIRLERTQAKSANAQDDFGRLLQNAAKTAQLAAELPYMKFGI